MEKVQEILHPVPILNKKKELTRQKGDRKIRRGAAALSEPIDRVKGNFLEIKKEFTFYPFQKDAKFCVRNYSIIQSSCTPQVLHMVSAARSRCVA
jgi:hypothetical protein